MKKYNYIQYSTKDSLSFIYVKKQTINAMRYLMWCDIEIEIEACGFKPSFSGHWWRSGQFE